MPVPAELGHSDFEIVPIVLHPRTLLRTSSRPDHEPRNVYVREDHLLETVTDLLHQDEQLDDYGSLDVGACLRRRRLELVCSHKNRKLQSTAARKIINLPVPSGQMTIMAVSRWTARSGYHRGLDVRELS